MDITNDNADHVLKKESKQAPLPEKFYKELMRLLEENGRKAIRRAKIVAHETTENRRELLVLCMRELRALGYKLERPQNLQDRHVRALTQSWELRNLSPSTITNRLSCLRALAKWIGKAGMIRISANYVNNPKSVLRSQVTTVDKSWSAADIDVHALIRLIEQYDARVGLQLSLMGAFGLRRKEAVMFRPLKADMGTAIRVRDGTKGGRERVILVETEEQRTVLDDARSRVKSVNEHIGHPDMNLEQAIRRFSYVLTKFGVTKKDRGITSHGLRHQHLNDLYERVTGEASPVRSGSLTSQLDELTHNLGRARVSQDAGHARLGICSAYIGARPSKFHQFKNPDHIQRFRELLRKDDLDNKEATELGYLILKMSKEE